MIETQSRNRELKIERKEQFFGVVFRALLLLRIADNRKKSAETDQELYQELDQD